MFIKNHEKLIQMKGLAMLYLIIFLVILILVSVFVFFYFFRYRITIQVAEEYLWNRYQDLFPQIIGSSIKYENKGNIPFQFILANFVSNKLGSKALGEFFNKTIGKCFEVGIDGEVFKNMPEGCERKFFEDKITLPLYVESPKPIFKTSEITIKISEKWAVKCTQQDYCEDVVDQYGLCSYKRCYDYPDYAGSSTECENNVKIFTKPC
jgi:hypothetical protein